MNKNFYKNYFKGFRKSASKLLKELTQYLDEVRYHLNGFVDTCEYHLEVNSKNYDEYANLQCICDYLSSKVDEYNNIIKDDGLDSELEEYDYDENHSDEPEKTLKALEIIKEKADMKTWLTLNKEYMTQEEFDLLKEVLK